jgi:hypothetical protein
MHDHDRIARGMKVGRMKRREFVLAGITAAGAVTCALAPVRGSPAFPPTPIPAGKRPLFAVIYDRRFEAAQAFANAAAWRGHKVLGYDGDLTAVWLREIEPRWSRRAGALAGMSTPTALFCLEQLAAQHWLRVVTRNEQRMGAGELLISWVIA